MGLLIIKETNKLFNTIKENIMKEKDENPWEKIGETLDEFEQKFYKAKECCHDSPKDKVSTDVCHWLVLARRDLNSAISMLQDVIASE